MYWHTANNNASAECNTRDSPVTRVQLINCSAASAILISHSRPHVSLHRWIFDSQKPSVRVVQIKDAFEMAHRLKCGKATWCNMNVSYLNMCFIRVKSTSIRSIHVMKIGQLSLDGMGSGYRLVKIGDTPSLIYVLKLRLTHPFWTFCRPRCISSSVLWESSILIFQT